MARPDTTPIPPTVRERMAELDAITAEGIDTPRRSQPPREPGPHQPANFADVMRQIENRIAADQHLDTD